MTLGTGFVKTGDLLRIRFCLHETFQPTANSIYLDTVELKWNSSNTEGHHYVFQYRLEGTKEERGFRERFLIVDKNYKD